MTLPCKKIYIDSEFRSSDSKSSSEFKIDLPSSLLMPSNTIFHVDDVCIPHSWYTIEEGVNDTLYITASIPNVPNLFNYAVTVDKGMYSGIQLKTALQTKLDMLLLADSNPFNMTIDYSPLENTILIKSTTTGINFLIFSDAEITSNPKRSMNKILGNDTLSGIYTTTNTYESKYLDLQPIRNIYLSSPNLGTFTTIGPTGEASIIKKIPVTADNNEMIVDNVTASGDFLDCSRQTLRRLEFYLKDKYGTPIDLHGENVSFSLVFSQFKE